MIDFTIGDEARILLDAVDRFGQDRLAPAARTAEAGRTPDSAARQLYEDLGLIGLELPGTGLGMIERVLVNEALGRADPGAALALDRLGTGAYGLLAADDTPTAEAIAADPARRAWLVTPEDGLLSVTERHATGDVHFAPAGVTDLVVLCPTGIALIQQGLDAEPVRGGGLRATGPVRLGLDDVPVARFHRVATAPALARARLYLASLLVGVLEAAAGYARSYAMERVTFGKPIAHHQGLTFLLTDMNTAVTGCRLLVQEAAWRLDSGVGGPGAGIEAAATAFAEAVDQSAFVGPAAVQVLGGLGFMQDYPVEKHMREARAIGLLCGGLDLAREDAMGEPATALMAEGVF